MTKIEDLKIFIVTIDKYAIDRLREEFKDVENVSIYYGDIRNFYAVHSSDIDCLVSPANSFGYMTGSYDAALSDILGWNFQYKVRDYIKNNYYNEQPIGSSFIIDTDKPGIRLIHTPTMQYPSIIKDEMVVYTATRSTLICALQNDVKCIVLPVFGGAVGGVPSFLAASMMKKAYLQIKNRQGAEYDF